MKKNKVCAAAVITLALGMADAKIGVARLDRIGSDHTATSNDV